MGNAFTTQEHEVLKLHYIRPDGDYENWGLHVWEGAIPGTEWHCPLKPKRVAEDCGAFFEIPGKGSINFIVHRGDEKENEGTASTGEEVWVVSGFPGTVFKERPDVSTLPRGTLGKQCAIWVLWDLVALPATMAAIAEDVVSLHASFSAKLEITKDGIQHADNVVALTFQPGGLPQNVITKFPHLKDYMAFSLTSTREDARSMLKAQVAVSVMRDGLPHDATGVQTAGAIDDMCKYDGPLGVTFSDEAARITLWAPTASSVTLKLWRDAMPGAPQAQICLEEGKFGEWSFTKPRSEIENMYFSYEIHVFCPWTNAIEKVDATDPYSHSLAANGRRTHIADLNAVASKPAGWDDLELPPACHPVDMSIYELHVRDFSASDKTVPEDLRGTFAAFGCCSVPGGGNYHLAELSQAGLTHVHLLPTFDFGSVDEIKANWKQPSIPDDVASLSELPSDSELQQQLLAPTFDHDGFNWGYDPQHYSAPEGSYATDPDGLARVVEFRGMVASMAKMGLRVVMDVVYNHVCSAGPHSPTSVLDKVVPGYYLRRSVTGAIESSTCCNNTATEHAMFDRLVIDSLVHWAKQYKVCGFRFDLMGHMMLSTVLRAREAVQKLTLEHDGVDGKSVYFYGEGWDFGEVAGCARGVNGSQFNLKGTGIGSFNDRIRDAVIGGSPFGDPREQGFATGIGTDHNGFEGTTDVQKQSEALQQYTEKLIVALAGNLADFPFENIEGRTVLGKDAGGPGSNSGYTASPTETINYVSAHDNETLFDMMVLKIKPGQETDVYVRRSLFCTAFVAFAQGVPFFHAGDDALRSKSLDRDSYNSGDHFNCLDWTLTSNNFGVGLPPASKNREKWELMKPLLRNKSVYAPPPSTIKRASIVFREMLQVRYSSPLFRLRTPEDVKKRVRFFNSGPEAVPGVIVMVICDDADKLGLPQLDPNFAKLVVIFNARPEPWEHREAAFLAAAGKIMRLHPVLAASEDGDTRTANWPAGGFPFVPGATAAVFVQSREEP